MYIESHRLYIHAFLILVYIFCNFCNIKYMTKKYIAILSISAAISFGVLYAATTPKKVKTAKAPVYKLKVAAWLPSWNSTEAVLQTSENLDYINEISPFAYYVNSDGTLKDDITNDDAWNYLDDQIKDYKGKNKNISIIPSILWTDRTQMEEILNDKKKRDAHIQVVVDEVLKENYAGIDIDYENKSAETRVGFSQFLTDLSKILHAKNKKLVCTIEQRTPIDSRYSVVSQELLDRIEYSNDYKVIGSVCDSVRIMTYDQVGGDVKLEATYSNSFYRPVADIEWVKKVLTLVMRDIPAEKIYVGVATYGYKYEITRNNDNTISYSRIGSMNYKYADELAKSIKVTPTRHPSGELYFTYSTSTSVDGSPLGSTKEYLVWYSDSQAIKDKYRIASLYKLGGIAIFKIDGANDLRVWDVVK